MKTHLLLLTFATLVAATCARGSGVGWSNSPFDTVPMMDNFGNALDSTYVFELGTFANGFVPTAANTDQWSVNWKLLSVADAPDDWFPNVPSFGQSFTFNANGTVQGLPGSATFTAGEQAYLWVYSGVQWALVTDNSPGATADDIWQLPTPGDNSPTSQLTWVLDQANVAIVGGVNGVQSGTAIAFDPGSNFRLQMAVIPEPSSCLLVLLAGVLARFHRFRRR